MGHTRQRITQKKKYNCCKTCSDDVAGFCKCKKGYDNFYMRKGKNNGCSKCISEMEMIYIGELHGRKIK